MSLPPRILLLLTLLATGASAGELAISVESPWARASAGPTGAAYMILTNRADRPDRLIAAASPIARTVELHTHQRDGDIMRMRRIDAIEVKPGEPTALRPGGLHVMLIGLTAPLRAGDRFPLTLTFSAAGEVAVEVPIEAAGAMAAPHTEMPAHR